MSQCRVPWLVRLLYTHNPFYLISACLFVYGLKLLFRAGNSAVLFQRGTVEYMSPTGLMGSLAAVTLLMAVTAVLIVRLGKVWEDARSLVLIVLLMLLAISVSLDELLSMASEQEKGLLEIGGMVLSGAAIAVGMVELLIRGLQVRLSWLWRGPLYLLLTLFFGWPLLLLPEIMPFDSAQVQTLIAVFPTAAALVSLLLLPGIRRGSASVKNNGTPWTWPWLPWTPFVFLAVAICFRSYSLTISFDAPDGNASFWDTIFGLYLLVPLALAVIVLLLEIGIVEKRPQMCSTVLTCSPVLMLMAWPWAVPWSRLPSYYRFATEFSNSYGSPVFLTLVALLVISAWAWRRGVARGESMTWGFLLLATLVGPGTLIHPYAPLFADQFQVLPVMMLASLKLASAFYRNRTGDLLTGLVIFALLPMLVKLPQALLPWKSFLSLHLAYVAVLIVARFRIDQAEWRRTSAVFLLATLIIGLVMLIRRHESPIVLAIYFVTVTMFAAMCYRWLNERWYLVVTVLNCCAGLVGGFVGAFWTLSTTHMESGMRQVIFGGISFLAAVIISILKTDVGRRLKLRLAQTRRVVLEWIFESNLQGVPKSPPSASCRW
ncbi:MAG: hypothetical protein U0936_15030 [Planctomycetaceae bacterium]